MKPIDPSSMPRGARRFVSYWLMDAAQDFHLRGFSSFIPVSLIFSCMIGGAIAYFAKGELWSDLQNAIAFYAAILAVNAILLAICWAAFSRILDCLSEGEFGAWVRVQKMDGYYGFYVDYVHLLQVVALSVAAAGLAFSVLPVPELYQRVLLGSTIAFSLLAGRWAAGCVRIMQELTDLRARHRDDRASNVASMPSGKSG